MHSQKTDTPTFSVTGSTVTFENPKVKIDGIMLYREAHIEINTEKMSSGFLHLLMWHMGEGHIKVKVANKKESNEETVTN